MKTIMKYKTAILSFTVCLFSSCGSDFLDPKPLSFYAPENALMRLDYKRYWIRQ